MSIWGKIIGGAAGFAMGGPIGALLGAAAGHAMDRMQEGIHGHGGAGGDNTRTIAFTIGVVVLSAKMAKADGRVTRDEVETFKRIFRVPPGEERNVGRVFNMARRDAGGFEPYARQIAGLFQGAPRVLEDLLGALFAIALADGVLHPAEERFLKQVAAIFGFSEADFARIRESHMGRDAGDPYAILGLTRQASDGELKKSYHKLIRENHPDRLIAQGLPQEFIDVANDKMAAINDAWDRIEKERGL